MPKKPTDETQFHIPIDYFASPERASLLLMLGQVRGVSQTGDGIAFQIFYTFKLAANAKRFVTHENLLRTMPSNFVDWAFEAGLVFKNPEGDIGCIYQDIVVGHTKGQTVPVEKPQSELVSEFELQAVYDLYPKRGGGPMAKLKGMNTLKRLPRTELPALTTAVLNIKSMRERTIISKDEFVPQWATFANNWRDYLPENTDDDSSSGFNNF